MTNLIQKPSFREKDGLIIGLRQNLLTLLRLKSLKKRIIRKRSKFRRFKLN